MKSKLILAAIAGLTLSANPLFAEDKNTPAPTTTETKKGSEHGCGSSGCGNKKSHKKEECTKNEGTCEHHKDNNATETKK